MPSSGSKGWCQGQCSFPLIWQTLAGGLPQAACALRQDLTVLKPLGVVPSLLSLGHTYLWWQFSKTDGREEPGNIFVYARPHAHYSTGVSPFGSPQSDETSLLTVQLHREENQGKTKQTNNQKPKTNKKANDLLRPLGWSAELWALVEGMRKRDSWGGCGYEGGVVGCVRLGAGISQAFKRGSRSPLCLGANLGKELPGRE